MKQESTWPETADEPREQLKLIAAAELMFTHRMEASTDPDERKECDLCLCELRVNRRLWEKDLAKLQEGS